MRISSAVLGVLWLLGCGGSGGGGGTDAGQGRDGGPAHDGGSTHTDAGGLDGGGLVMDGGGHVADASGSDGGTAPIDSGPPSDALVPPAPDSGTLATRNVYVTPSGAGSHDGSSWLNALAGIAGIHFSGAGAIGPGTVVWMAGGTYPGELSVSGSGTATARIYMERATAANPECTGAAGWSPSFDSQVVLDGGGDGTPISFPASGGGDYFTLDGQVDDGIQLHGPDNDGAGVAWGGPASHVELLHLDIVGVTNANAHTFRGDSRGVDATLAVHTDDLVISHCKIHGFPNLVYTANVHGVLIEHSRLYDNSAANSATYHPNAYISTASSDIVFRYNDVSGWAAEGILLWGGPPQTNVRIYGNVFHDRVDGAYARVLELQNGMHGPVYLYDNTFVNMWLCVLDDSGGGIFAAGSQARNNIFWNVPGWGTSALDHDYDLTDADGAGTHGISHAPNPFADYAGHDYHLSAATGAMSARDHGTPLAAEYATDADGRTRGADGSWDIGAFEH